ncbi:MAG: class I SAM-dependent methyltransferase [Pseudomonadales bacterium]|nr:class I SAM-dependent methyltransferase [Pseudomonadales bacterium]
MKDDPGLPTTFDSSAIAKDEMNWDAYAEHYDLMCALNPAYQENINLLLERLRSWQLPSTSTICDVGAGTGNYICAMADQFPDGAIFHIDFDARMNELAQQKYLERGIKNVQILQDHILNIDLPKSSVDLVICINSIYAISPQKSVLEKAHEWLKPRGRLFAIDFGRKQRTLDWAIYLFRESLKSGEVGRYAKGLIEAREVMKQNRQSTKGQKSGRYWLHSTDDFGKSIADAGFEIEELFACYRGYADLAVCRPLSN